MVQHMQIVTRELASTICAWKKRDYAKSKALKIRFLKSNFKIDSKLAIFSP